MNDSDYIERLKNAVDCRSALRVPIESWDEIEEEVDYQFPSSLKQLGAEVGFGNWGKTFWFPKPCKRVLDDGWWKVTAPSFEEEEFGFDFRKGLERLFPWGYTEYRVHMFLQRSEECREGWRIIILEHGFEPEIWKMSIPEFLWKHFNSELESDLLPYGLRECPMVSPT